MESRRAKMSAFFMAALVLALVSAARTSEDVAELRPDWTPPDARVNLEEVREEMDDLQKLEALKKLKEILGIRGDLREESTRATPPQFMMELYNTVADSEGKILRKNPYDAKVVRSFLERDSTSSHFYIFNITSLEQNESVLEAELHLHRKRSSPRSMHPSVLSSPYYLISVYQVLPDKSLDEPDLHKLLNVHYVGAYASGWQVFNVKQAVLSWLTGAPNLGLLVTATTIFGDQVTVDFSRRDDQPRDKQPLLVLFNDDGSHLNDFVRFPVQPVLHSPYEASEYEGSADEELNNAEMMLEDETTETESRSRAKRRAEESSRGQGQSELPDYVDAARPVFFPREKKDRARKEEVVDVIVEEDVQKLERDRTRNKRQPGSVAGKGQPELPDYVDQHRPVIFEREKKEPARGGIDQNDIVRPQQSRGSTGFVRRKNPEQVLTSMDIYQRALLREKLMQSRNRASVRPAPRQSHRSERSIPSPSRAKRESECRKVEAEPCSKRELYVNFQEIGMTSIVAPAGYQAYQCRGHCKSPLSQDQKPTNHATIQGIINKMKLTPSQEVDMPCCVPAKLSSVSILYLDDDSAVVLKSYTDMVVNSCGCR